MDSSLTAFVGHRSSGVSSPPQAATIAAVRIAVPTGLTRIATGAYMISAMDRTGHVLAISPLPAVVAACTLLTSIEGLTGSTTDVDGGDAKRPDAAVASDAPSDAPSDASSDSGLDWLGGPSRCSSTNAILCDGFED